MSGVLPGGLSLNEDTGEISGTPAGEGTEVFTVMAVNDLGEDIKELSITIVKAPEAEYAVTVRDDGHGTGSADPASATAGTEITLTATPKTGYHFKEWEVISGGVTIKDDKFLMPNDNVEVKAIFEKDTGGGGGGYNPPVTYYTLRFETGGGSDIPSVRETYNTYIDLTKYVPTRHGYTFVGWYSEQSLVNKVSDIYLTGDRTVYAGWRAVTIPQTGDSGQMNLWSTALCASFAGCVALIVWKIRRREKKSL